MDNDIYCCWSTPGVHYWSGGVPSDTCYLDYDQQQCSNNKYHSECNVWWESGIRGCGDDNSNCCCHVASNEVSEVGILNTVEG